MRISIQEQILFYKNLAVMTKAGIPILDSLRMLRKQTKSRSMIKILTRLTDDVANGQFLSTSMANYPKAFDESSVNIVRIGEASGIFYENLNYLAEELKKRRELNKKVRGALAYPIIVIIAAIGIVGLLTLYVFPKIIPVIKNLKGEPPLPTKILIAMSDFITAYWPYLGGGIILFLILSRLLIVKVQSIKFFFHRIILSTPLVGQISRNYNLVTFTRTLGLLLKSDIKVVEALRLTADTLTNLIYRRELKQLAENVSRGEELSVRLERKEYLFPVILSQMIAIGEKTGNLTETLLYLADVYETELDDLTKNLSTILEPALMIILGLIVAFVAISIIAPIYQITQSL